MKIQKIINYFLAIAAPVLGLFGFFLMVLFASGLEYDDLTFGQYILGELFASLSIVAGIALHQIRVLYKRYCRKQYKHKIKRLYK